MGIGGHQNGLYAITAIDYNQTHSASALTGWGVVVWLPETVAS
jgi:hypothetical protein